MSDLHKIHGLLSRTRGRMRTQAALEWGTTALILALAGSLVVFWLWRMDYLTDLGTNLALVGLGAAVLVAAVVGASRKIPTHLVAARLDKASNLNDRLGTAVEFSRRLGDAKQKQLEHPDTVALMQAAILDAERAVPRANVEAAAPIKAPKDLKPATVFAVVTAAICSLAFAPEPPGLPLEIVDSTGDRAGLNLADPDSKALDPDDIDYSRQYVKDLREMAEQTGDPFLKKFAEELEALLDKAEKGEISKEELLAEMEQLEKKYMEGSDQSEEAMLAELKDSGKELKKEPLTKRLGEALEAGDMDAAKKELDRLAEQIEKKELTPKEEKKIADAIEKATKKAEDKEKKDKESAQKKIDKKKDEIRKLEKKAKADPKNEDTQRKLDKEKRELEKLQRDKEEKEQQAEKRSLKRLQRKMKSAANNLKNQDKQDREERRKQAADDMRKAGEESEKAGDDMKKAGNQKRAQSQLGDLKDSIRRAKMKNGGNQKGQGQKQARMQRIKEWESRAGGGKGDGQAWKGQGKGQGQGQGQGKDPGQGQGGQKCDNPPCAGIGDSHDPDLMGDPTKLSGKKDDKQLGGKHGRGPSRRETIITSAKKGFASQSYKKVYADYRKIVEEVMSQEKVPQGYKYYVKRYFNRIKPHSM